MFAKKEMNCVLNIKFCDEELFYIWPNNYIYTARFSKTLEFLPSQAFSFAADHKGECELHLVRGKSFFGTKEYKFQLNVSALVKDYQLT